jgi:predicted DNA-binding transcriptional regulator AlpA
MSRHDTTPIYCDATRTAARYNKTIRTIDRWADDPRMGFPQPVYLGRMRFWRVADLEAWEAEQVRRAQDNAA